MRDESSIFVANTESRHMDYVSDKLIGNGCLKSCHENPGASEWLSREEFCDHLLMSAMKGRPAKERIKPSISYICHLQES